MKQKVDWRVAIFLAFVLLLLLLPCATSQLTVLTDEEAKKYPDDSTGMLNGGKDIVYVPWTDGITETSFVIKYYNTKDETVTYVPKIRNFWEERVHEIKEDYIFYLLPDLKWVSLSHDECVLPHNSVFEVTVTITMPTDEAKRAAGDGGFIFMIDGETNGHQVNAMPGRKEFLIFYDDDAIGTPIMPGGSFDNTLFIYASGIVGACLCALFVGGYIYKYKFGGNLL